MVEAMLAVGRVICGMVPQQSDLDRLYTKIAHRDGHRVWTAGGHGNTGTIGWGKRTVNPARLLWEIEGYGTLDSRTILHRTCDVPLCVEPEHHSTSRYFSLDDHAKHPFVRALVAACAKIEITPVEALRRAGLSKASDLLRAWVLGGAVPWRESIEKVAEVIGVPELVGFIETRQPPVTLTCPNPNSNPDCMRTWTIQPGLLRARVKQSHDVNSKTGVIDAEINFEAGAGTTLCSTCIKSLTAKAVLTDRVVRNHGRPALRARQRKVWAERSPESQQAFHEAGQAALRGRPRTEKQIRAQARSRIKPRVTEVYNLCPFCKRIVATARTLLLRNDQRGEVHADCYHTWLSETGQSFGARPPELPRGQPSSEYLMGSRVLAVLHLLKKKPVAGRRGLAETYGMTRDGVLKRIRTFIDDYLPLPGEGSGTLALLALALREARSKK